MNSNKYVAYKWQSCVVSGRLIERKVKWEWSRIEEEEIVWQNKPMCVLISWKMKLIKETYKSPLYNGIHYLVVCKFYRFIMHRLQQLSNPSLIE